MNFKSISEAVDHWASLLLTAKPGFTKLLTLPKYGAVIPSPPPPHTSFTLHRHLQVTTPLQLPTQTPTLVEERHPHAIKLLAVKLRHEARDSKDEIRLVRHPILAYTIVDRPRQDTLSTTPSITPSTGHHTGHHTGRTTQLIHQRGIGANPTRQVNQAA